jgi:hypothetical protein
MELYIDACVRLYGVVIIHKVYIRAVATVLISIYRFWHYFVYGGFC